MPGAKFATYPIRDLSERPLHGRRYHEQYGGTRRLVSPVARGDREGSNNPIWRAAN